MIPNDTQEAETLTEAPAEVMDAEADQDVVAPPETSQQSAEMATEALAADDQVPAPDDAEASDASTETSPEPTTPVEPADDTQEAEVEESETKANGQDFVPFVEPVAETTPLTDDEVAELLSGADTAEAAPVTYAEAMDAVSEGLKVKRAGWPDASAIHLGVGFKSTDADKAATDWVVL